MQNPAWRPARLHTERLASISHHFMSENRATRNTGKEQYLQKLPVLVAVEAAHPPGALQADYLIDALTRQLNLQSPGAAKRHGWKLMVNPSSRMLEQAGSHCILVFATASLAGIRLAYSQIKQLSQRPVQRVGVLFSGARDRDVARRCYERLAEGAKQFLGLELHLLGHLSAPGPNFGAGLAQLAGEIQSLCAVQSDNK